MKGTGKVKLAITADLMDPRFKVWTGVILDAIKTGKDVVFVSVGGRMFSGPLVSIETTGDTPHSPAVEVRIAAVLEEREVPE